MRKKVAKELIKQSLNDKKINVHKAMIKSGYARTTANCKTSEVVKSNEVQQELGNFIDQLDGLVQDNIKHMQSKQKKASFRDANNAVESMSKLKQLVSGKPTESVMEVKWEE